MKLHLGSGGKTIEGFLNIDIQDKNGVDLICDVSNLPFDKNSIEEIYACAIIEHFGRHEWLNVIKHWYDLLKPGGCLRISTADFESCCDFYQKEKDIKKILGLIVGGQKDYTDKHGMIFDFKILKSELSNIGFKNIERYDWRDFIAFKNKNYDDYSRSYIPHMNFDNGSLMMLNVIGYK